MIDKPERDYRCKHDFMTMTYLTFDGCKGVIPRDHPDVITLQKLASKADDQYGARLGISIGLTRIKEVKINRARDIKAQQIKDRRAALKARPKPTRLEVMAGVREWIEHSRKDPELRELHLAEHDAEVALYVENQTNTKLKKGNE